MKCRCGRIMPPERTQKNCEACIAGATERYRRRYERLRQAGLCRRCGDPIEPERAGRSICRECNAVNTAYERVKQPVRVAQRRRRRRMKRARMALLKMRVRA